MRKILLYGLGVLILLGTFFGAKYIIDNNNKPKPKVDKVIKTVFVETVKNDTVPITIAANGTLQAKERLELYSEVQGIFQSSAKDFKVGQPYRKGQTLIRVNAAEYYASVQSAKSEFYNLVTSLMPDLRLDYPDAFPKWQAYLDNFNIDNSVPPLPETSSENVKYFVTGRGVYSSYYNLKNLEQRLGKYSIYAPFDGILTEALVTKGTLIRQGQKLGEYINTSVFEVELAIGKTFSDLLKLGENVELSLPQSSKTYTGTVSRVNGRIDPATQTIQVFVEVKGEDLKEGMYLEAQLEAREQPNAIKISRKLLVDESEIYIVRDSVLDIIPVQPVHFSPKEVVVQGVPDGTKILSKSIPGAYAGMLVKVNESSTPSSANTETVE
ncbi:MAG TPA: HlyD family efflux transporter periplasmic adaptor subunit [Flavobacteriaceae bacterium]|jgi:multidrug efflux pump subunit AcrA (membrane-fusion protein)|nr:efflux transporter periplasmic adaptor subunit [Flavobacteriaceae bacterium]HIB49482.1 HlyD family efflux transporter periplasmic adaptor subunit [Flavobacteriaceae bacterium]HIN98117.1 HlyD family efflux transporter periplasmic adaptor subunit [Flavobacteriaceae bacterium]|tara:strand:- start:6858 stop:8003 length:1146 start_codon:yes stop_codon:yes gene_type:complete